MDYGWLLTSWIFFFYLQTLACRRLPTARAFLEAFPRAWNLPNMAHVPLLRPNLEEHDPVAPDNQRPPAARRNAPAPGVVPHEAPGDAPRADPRDAPLLPGLWHRQGHVAAVQRQQPRHQGWGRVQPRDLVDHQRRRNALLDIDLNNIIAQRLRGREPRDRP